MSKRKKIVIAVYIIFAIIAIGGITAFGLISSNRDVVEFNMSSTTQTLEYGDSFTAPDVKATGHGSFFNKEKKNLEVISDGNVDETKLGSYVLTYSATYKDVTKKISITVNVVDTITPEINLVINPDSFTSPIAEYEEEGFTATDNYDGDITDKVVRTPGDGVVNYTVVDSSGNETTVTRTITYKDAVPPTLTLSGNTSMVVELGTEYSEPGFSANDDVDGDITANVTVNGNVDTNTAGIYNLNYEVRDNSDNVATAKRTVSVYKKQELATPVNPGDKVVYLTFDDGPYAYTQQLLDVLDKYNVKVTFFVTNQYPDYQNMIAEEAKRGHTVAIHTYSHRYENVYSSVDAYYDDLNKISDIIVAQTGKKPNIVRFPGGTSNTISRKYCAGIMGTLSQSLPANGYYFSDWNVSSGDAGGTTSTDQVAANVIAGMQRNNVSIVLQHDIKSFSVNAVEQIIQWGLSNGYTFLPMDETTPMVHQGVNN